MPCHYPLADVKALAAAGAFQLRSASSLRPLLGDVDLQKRSRAFVRAVIERLDTKHFSRTTRDMTYQGKPTAYDVCGLGFAKAELIQVGFPDDDETSLPINWMFKLAIVEDGTLLDVLSLHPPLEPLRLENGAILLPRVSQ